jgi:hypothetical protein
LAGFDALVDSEWLGVRGECAATETLAWPGRLDVVILLS